MPDAGPLLMIAPFAISILILICGILIYKGRRDAVITAIVLNILFLLFNYSNIIILFVSVYSIIVGFLVINKPPFKKQI